MKKCVGWVALLVLACAGTTQAQATYRNPILYSDYSDPDVIRVGSRYYMTASSFHFSPGLPLLESRDLVHWRLLTRPLRRASQLNMLGDPDSCGIWAPCLTHADGQFYLEVSHG